MTKGTKKEIKKEVIGQNEYMTIIKVYKTCYGFTEKNNNNEISLHRVTTTKSPIGTWELKRLKFKNYYKIQLKDSFTSQLKLSIGKQIINSWGNKQWNYDEDEVNEYISKHAPVDVSKFIREGYRAHNFYQPYGDPYHQINRYNSAIDYEEIDVYDISEGVVDEGLSSAEKKQERNKSTRAIMDTVLKSQMDKIQDEFGLYVYQARQEKSICMGKSWQKDKDVITRMIKEWVETKVIKALNDIGLTGKFGGEIAINGDLIKDIKFIEQEK